MVIGIGGMDANAPVMPKIMEEAGIRVFTVTDVEKQGISDVVNLAGFDICCVAPAYDNQGIGGLTAVRFFIERHGN